MNTSQLVDFQTLTSVQTNIQVSEVFPDRNCFSNCSKGTVLTLRYPTLQNNLASQLLITISTRRQMIWKNWTLLLKGINLNKGCSDSRFSFVACYIAIPLNYTFSSILCWEIILSNNFSNLLNSLNGLTFPSQRKVYSSTRWLVCFPGTKLRSKEMLHTHTDVYLQLFLCLCTIYLYRYRC